MTKNYKIPYRIVGSRTPSEGDIRYKWSGTYRKYGKQRWSEAKQRWIHQAWAFPKVETI